MRCGEKGDSTAHRSNPGKRLPGRAIVNAIDFHAPGIEQAAQRVDERAGIKEEAANTDAPRRGLHPACYTFIISGYLRRRLRSPAIFHNGSPVSTRRVDRKF
jgi:hypothetical protein